MAEQKLSEGRFRRDDDDDDGRRPRRDDESDWGRNDREQGVGRGAPYGRSNQSSAGSGEFDRWQQSASGGGREYGGQRSRSGLGSHGEQGDRWGHWHGQHDGNQGDSRRGRYGAGREYGSEGRFDYGMPRNYGSPQYGSFGVTESGGATLGREWPHYGGSGSRPMGSWQTGEHRGKGPKGYTRSDERIREDVCDRLSDDDELDASEITVTVKDGEVTLEGTVTDRHAKHRAEDLAEAVGGVRDVDNKLRKHKGMLQEMSDRLTGNQEDERSGHAGSGTKNAPSRTSVSR